MTRQRTHIVLYLDANEADTLINLLTDLRNNLWASYGDEIIELRRVRENTPENADDLNNDINF